MSIADLVPSPDDPLDAFDANEAADLALHYRQELRRFKAIERKIARMTKLLWFICAIGVMNLLKF